MLNPAFNINHMREMIPIFYEVTHKVTTHLVRTSVFNGRLTWEGLQLRSAIEGSLKNGPQEINLVNWMGRTALELVGQAGLGYSFDSLTEESMDTYGSALKVFMCVAHFYNGRHYSHCRSCGC